MHVLEDTSVDPTDARKIEDGAKIGDPRTTVPMWDRCPPPSILQVSRRYNIPGALMG
jgi:hypothetical protein